jgi:hypothetical protein
MATWRRQSWKRSGYKVIPPACRPRSSIEHIPSLVALFEEACRKYADKVAYISMGAK